MGKGSKTCASCQQPNGPRSLVCKHCGAGFIIKGKKQPTLVAASVSKRSASREVMVADSRKQLAHKEIDWKELKKNDVIKVISGGPYWPAKNEESQPIPLGYHGIFAVSRIDDEGIHAYPIKAKTEGHGHCFIYLGPDKVMKSGTIMRKHNIVRVHRKVKE